MTNITNVHVIINIYTFPYQGQGMYLDHLVNDLHKSFFVLTWLRSGLDYALKSHANIVVDSREGFKSNLMSVCLLLLVFFMDCANSSRLILK